MGYISEVTGSLDVVSSRPNQKVLSRDFVREAEKSGITLPDYRVSAQDLRSDLVQRFGPLPETHWIAGIDDTSDGYVVYYSNDGKAYEIKSDVEKIVDYFKSQGFTVSGKIFINGEANDDFSRIVVKDNNVVMEEATVSIVFPDGSIWEDW